MLPIILRQVTKFTAIGVLTALVNILVFKYLLFLGYSLGASVALGNLCSILVNYSGLRSLFQGINSLQLFLKYILSVFIYYQASMISMHIYFYYKPEAFEIEARIVVLLLITPVNFLVQKLIIFKAD